MKKPTKSLTAAAIAARKLVATNFAVAISDAYPNESRTDAYKTISGATGVSVSTLQRIEHAAVGASVDTLADIARHLGTSLAALHAPREVAAVRRTFRGLERAG